MGIAGHLSIVLADIVVGILSGAAVLAATCGAMLPFLAYAISGERGRKAGCGVASKCHSRRDIWEAIVLFRLSPLIALLRHYPRPHIIHRGPPSIP